VTRRGFTLIELLVVMAIVSVLIGMVLPALSAARETGRQSVCLSNLRGLVLGVEFYAQASDDWLPAAEPPMREFPDARHWFMNPSLLSQMSVERLLDDDGVPVGPSRNGLLLTCPSHEEPDRWQDGTLLDYVLSYAVNGTWGLGGRPDHLEQRRRDEFARTSDVMALTDACGIAAAPGIVLYNGCAEHNFDYRHRGRVQAAWLDGHVTPMSQDGIPFGMARRYEAFWSARNPCAFR